MKPKKSPKKDLRPKRQLFFMIGLCVSLFLCIVAFEWKTMEVVNDYPVENPPELMQVVDIPPTAIKPPEPPKVHNPVLIAIPDDVDIDPDLPDITFIEEDDPVAPAIEDPIPDEIIDVAPVVIAEKMPEFPGGIAAFYRWVGKSMKYPQQAKRQQISGRVFVQFVIDKDGSVKEVQVVKGVGAGCDLEAIRVIKNSPKWHAGKNRGRPVKVRMILPITFKLQ
ncbi:TonB family protein [Persicobacter psychrovividus]|uniref:Protein TonB n=1 Tax=Persicobacter psychrovividus TaxID=387638 RepID=A0ABN6L9I6_9BACT|nr:protein TonB [Persicobacter psychrovividus]